LQEESDLKERLNRFQILGKGRINSRLSKVEKELSRIQIKLVALGKQKDTIDSYFTEIAVAPDAAAIDSFEAQSRSYFDKILSVTAIKRALGNSSADPLTKKMMQSILPSNI
jgi:hypothetical protein